MNEIWVVSFNVMDGDEFLNIDEDRFDKLNLKSIASYEHSKLVTYVRELMAKMNFEEVYISLDEDKNKDTVEYLYFADISDDEFEISVWFQKIEIIV